MDPRLGVRPGQRIAVAADHINFVNGLMKEPKANGGGAIAMAAPPYTMLRCKNNSGSVVPQFGVLAITGLAVAFTSPQFKSEPVLTGGTPTASSASWCVALEPIKAGKTGPVAVAGVTQTKINVSDAGHAWCHPGTTVNELVSDCMGSAKIIAKESGTGAGKLAFIQLGFRDLRLVTDFDEEAVRQFLVHEEGCLKWLDELSCEELEGL
jgi:hypothetical protein